MKAWADISEFLCKYEKNGTQCDWCMQSANGTSIVLTFENSGKKMVKVDVKITIVGFGIVVIDYPTFCKKFENRLTECVFVMNDEH